MELVAAILRGHEGFFAAGVGFSGRLPVEQLYRAGTPVGDFNRGKVQVDFSNWHLAPLAEYCAAFGMSKKDVPGHIGWSFSSCGRTYVVPTLVILQGLLKPGSWLFQHLFRAQSLDSICRFDGDGVMPAIVSRYMHPSVGQLLAWLYCYPSARAMWSSVYDAATQGFVGVKLPEAVAAVCISGVRRDETIFVTKFVVSVIEPTEQPFSFCPKAALAFPLHARAAKSVARSTTSGNGGLLNRTEGRVSLTKEEWDSVERAYLTTSFVRQKKNDLRTIVEAVLTKHALNLPWTLVPYPAGVEARIAADAYRRWVANGRWAPMLAALRQHRPDFLTGALPA